MFVHVLLDINLHLYVLACNVALLLLIFTALFYTVHFFCMS